MTGKAHGFGNYVQGPELRLRNSCEHRTGSRKNPLAMQFHGHQIDFAGEGFSSCSVNFSFVLRIPIAKGVPEIRKVLANLCPVATESSDHFCARWRREFSQRLSNLLTNTFTYSMAGLLLCDASPAGSQRHRQFP